MLTYRDSGVDIDAGARAAERIARLAGRRPDPRVLAGIGGFAALYDTSNLGYRSPVLVSCTDSVGTKLLVAQALNQHDTVGIDSVAMCVNDLICTGARPLFFLDYIGCGKVEEAVIEAVAQGIVHGCNEAGCALVGGETAELPGMYPPDEYDLVGFAVGMVEKDDILHGNKAQVGDVLLGLASTGLHSNGFSLARKALLEQAGLGYADSPAGLGCTLGEEMLRPTAIYVQAVLPLLEAGAIRAVAHITGGGIYDNLPRVLPNGVCAVVDKATWRIPPIFHLIQEAGQVEEREMFRVFNMGIGMILVVAAERLDEVKKSVSEAGRCCYRIGELQGAEGPPRAEVV